MSISRIDLPTYPVEFVVGWRVSNGVHSQILKPRSWAAPQRRLESLWPYRLNGQHPSSLLRQLRPRLRVRVEQRKVTDDDGDGESNRQHPGQGTNRPNEHTEVGFRSHITVSDCSHRNNSPPETEGYRCEVVVLVRFSPLGVEY